MTGPDSLGVGSWTQSMNNLPCEDTYHCPCKQHVVQRTEEWFATVWPLDNATA